MANTHNTSGTKISLRQDRASVTQHMDHIDMTDLRQAEWQAGDNALAALDARFGFESWVNEGTRIQGSEFVTVFTPQTEGTRTRVFAPTTKENK